MVDSIFDLNTFSHSLGAIYCSQTDDLTLIDGDQGSWQFRIPAKPCEQWSVHPGWLGFVGDYTTHLYRDFNKEL